MDAPRSPQTRFIWLRVGLLMSSPVQRLGSDQDAARPAGGWARFHATRNERPAIHSTLALYTPGRMTTVLPRAPTNGRTATALWASAAWAAAVIMTSHRGTYPMASPPYTAGAGTGSTMSMSGDGSSTRTATDAEKLTA